MQKFETTIASLAKRGEALAAKRVTVQQRLDKALASRQNALLAGDLDDQRAIERLQQDVDSSTSALSGIDDALGLLSQQKADAERQLAEKRGAIERAKAADEITAAVTAIENRIESLLSEMRGMSSALAAADHLAFEIGQLGQYLAGAAGETEIALAFVVPMLHRQAAAVKDGHEPIPRRPQAEPVAVPVPAPETRRLFALRSVKWRDHDGELQFGKQYEDHDLPPGAAQRGLRIGAVVPLEDPRRRELKGARGGEHINQNAPDVLDLDDETATRPPHIEPIVASDPIASANFKIVDRSHERRTVQTAGPLV